MTAPHVEAAANALAAAGLDVFVRPGRGMPVVQIDHVRGVFTLEAYPNGDVCLWAVVAPEEPVYWGVGGVSHVLRAVRDYVNPTAPLEVL